MNLMPKKKVKKSVDEVLGVFQKTIQELEDLSHQADLEVDTLNGQKRDIEIEIEATAQESRRAKKIKAQIEAVVQG